MERIPVHTRHTHTRTHTYIHTHAHTHTHTRNFVPFDSLFNTHTHTHTHTEYTHVHMHIRYTQSASLDLALLQCSARPHAPASLTPSSAPGPPSRPVRPRDSVLLCRLDSCVKLLSPPAPPPPPPAAPPPPAVLAPLAPYWLLGPYWLLPAVLGIMRPYAESLPLPAAPPAASAAAQRVTACMMGEAQVEAVRINTSLFTLCVYVCMGVRICVQGSGARRSIPERKHRTRAPTVTAQVLVPCVLCPLPPTHSPMHHAPPGLVTSN